MSQGYSINLLQVWQHKISVSSLLHTTKISSVRSCEGPKTLTNNNNFQIQIFLETFHLHEYIFMVKKCRQVKLSFGKKVITIYSRTINLEHNLIGAMFQYGFWATLLMTFLYLLHASLTNWTEKYILFSMNK